METRFLSYLERDLTGKIIYLIRIEEGKTLGKALNNEVVVTTGHKRTRGPSRTRSLPIE